MRSVLLGLGQLACALAALAGLYMLTCTAVTLIVGGALGFGVLLALEMLAAPPRTRRAPDPALTELPGAPRSRPTPKD
jgi:hypothetical protein